MLSQSVRKEISALLVIGLPLIGAYLAEFAMFVTTKIVVGRLGYHELAAVGIAGNTAFEILVILMGILSIVGVLCAQAEGGGRKKDAGVAVRQGLLVSLVLGLPAMWGVWHIDAFLDWTGQDPVVVALAGDYLRMLSPSVLPVLFFAVLRNFVAAMAQPRMVMVITVISVGINYLLTLWLVNGGFGVPAMGVGGAGLATTLVNWLMFLMLLVHVYRKPSLRGYGVFLGRWRVDLPVCWEILYLGIPVAGLVALEAGLFLAASVLSGRISAETLAAYEITLSWVGVSFMTALGLAEATMVRVAHGIGSDSPAAARRAGMVGMGLGVSILVTLVVFPLVFGHGIAAIFIDPGDPGSDVVTAMVIEFLAIAAIFQVFDGLQAIAARALRGMKDNFAPLWIAAFGYWVLGIGGGAWLAFGLEMGGHGIWWGMALGLLATASLLAWRFHVMSRRLVLRGRAPVLAG